jgi:glyoxylase-like metal-dependent hydrolase (beta-lactamase superfamily II)
LSDIEWKVYDHSSLQPLAENLWVVDGSIPNMEIRRWMVVARLQNRDLVIWNAIAMDPAGMAALEALGRPAHLVVPNGWHRMDAGRFKERYPDLRVICPAGAKKMVSKKVVVDSTLEESPTPGGDDDSVRFETSQGPGALEGAMLVRSQDGETAVFGDLLFNCTTGPGFWWFMYGKVLGSAGGPKVTPMTKALLLFTGRKKNYRNWMTSQAQRGAIVRIVPGHGAIIRESACEVLSDVASRF